MGRVSSGATGSLHGWQTAVCVLLGWGSAEKLRVMLWRVFVWLCHLCSVGIMGVGLPLVSAGMVMSAVWLAPAIDGRSSCEEVLSSHVLVSFSMVQRMVFVSHHRPKVCMRTLGTT